MRLILLLFAATGLLALGGVAGYAGALTLIPYAATEKLLDQFRASGRADNTLTRPNVRNARRNLVVRDNADTVTQAATIDLANGPVLYETNVPADAVYWSVSLFAHNTDTVLLLTSGLGSGHMRAAEALAAAVHRLEPGANLRLLDFWSLMNPGVAASIKRRYLSLVLDHPDLYARLHRLQAAGAR